MTALVPWADVARDFSIHDLAPGEAQMVEWSFEHYLANQDCVSRSQLEDLRANPQLYYKRHVDHTLPWDTTAAMELGTYVHLAVLEPEEWKSRLYPSEPERPEDANGRAKKGSPEKVAYQQWKDEVARWEAGQTKRSIVCDYVDKVEAMAASVRGHAFAGRVLESPGVSEQTIVWRHPDTGLVVRVRLDWLTQLDEDTMVLLDLKTTADPLPALFGASAAKLGYHRQAAIYYDAVKALFPDVDLHYALAAVRSKQPFDVSCYELGEDELNLGRTQYEYWMADLIRRREDQDWLAPWQRGCAILTLPRWAYEEEI